MAGGAELVADGLVLTENTSTGLSVSDATATLDNVSILDTAVGPDGLGGQGLAVQNAAVVLVTGSEIAGNSTTSVLASDGAYVELTGTAVVGTRATARPGGGVGLQPQAGGEIRVDDVAVRDCTGPGVYLVNGGAITGRDLRLSGNRFAGAVVFNGVLDVDELSVTDTLPDPEEQLAMGIFTSSEVGDPEVSLRDAALSGHPAGCVVLRGAGSFSLRRAQLSACGTSGLVPALYAMEGVARGEDSATNPGLLLAGSRFESLPGDAIVLDASSALLVADAETGAANSFADIGGEHLWQQGCDAPEEVVVLDGSVVPPVCGSTRVLNFEPSFAIYIDDGAEIVGP